VTRIVRARLFTILSALRSKESRLDLLPAQQIEPTRVTKKAVTILTFFAVKGGCNSPACEETSDLEHPVQQTSISHYCYFNWTRPRFNKSRHFKGLCAKYRTDFAASNVGSALISCRHVTAVDRLGLQLKFRNPWIPSKTVFTIIF
jgi:hypothetical protein